MSSGFDVVIGLEIHAQLMTKRKVFCTAPVGQSSRENTLVGVVSAGLPGALPVLNEEAVKLAVRAGLSLHCEIKKKSVFSRKNYFYPDLPKGYQISQFDLPICLGGHVDIDLDQQQRKRIHLERIHMEEDAGKSTHFSQATFVDLNRSGTPLIEIVSKPEISSAQEAVAYLRKVHAILCFAQVSDGNLEEGNFRCDVNLSVKPQHQKELGTRTELKNLNSFRFVEKAIDFEAARQIAVLQSGGKVLQETRGWDAASGKTLSQRSKEEAHDYRYFPDPDLPPLILTDDFIDRIALDCPELPEAKRQRFKDDYGLSDYDARQLTLDLEVTRFFEDGIKLGAGAKPLANWLLGEVLRRLRESDSEDLKSFPLTPTQLMSVIKLVESGEISLNAGKRVLDELIKTQDKAEKIVERLGLKQVSDPKELEQWSNEVIREQPDSVNEYKAGKEKVIAFLMGQIMKKSQGKANPSDAKKILENKLKE